jgi:hypothetical protein
MPATTAGTIAAKTASLSIAQRTLLLSSYVPFFLVPLVMTVDMGMRLLGYVRAGSAQGQERKLQ